MGQTYVSFPLTGIFHGSLSVVLMVKSTKDGGLG